MSDNNLAKASEISSQLAQLKISSSTISLSAKPSAQGAEVVVLLLDSSRSMADAMKDGTKKLLAAKQAIDKLISKKKSMAEGDLVGCVSFASFANVVARPTLDYTEVQRRVQASADYGSTNMAGGLQAGIRLIEAQEGSTSMLRRIILLSDGEPDDKESALAQTRACSNRGIVVDTVGLGEAGNWGYRGYSDYRGYNEVLLRRIAEETGGEFVHVNDLHTFETQFLRLAEEKKGLVLYREQE